MKLTNIKEFEAFRHAVDLCKGNVWLESVDGDRYNLKSAFSQYVAFGALLGEHGDKLELFCQYPSDEHYFYQFFQEHPEVL